jgi:hypothetical protein
VVVAAAVAAAAGGHAGHRERRRAVGEVGVDDQVEVARAGDRRGPVEQLALERPAQLAAVAAAAELDEGQARGRPALDHHEAAAVDDHAVTAGQRDAGDR